MPTTVDLTIAPNEKYRRVIGASDADTDRPEPQDAWPDDHQAAADAYSETIEHAPIAEELCEDFPAIPELTWADISPPDDPELLATVATYFDGMAPDEPTARLRAKCRLLAVDTYSNAQIAARSELCSE